MSPKQLTRVLRNQPKGREATPWLNGQRERFGKAAQEAGKEMADTKLKGAARVKAFNQLVRQKLQGGESVLP